MHPEQRLLKIKVTHNMAWIDYRMNTGNSPREALASDPGVERARKKNKPISY